MVFTKGDTFNSNETKQCVGGDFFQPHTLAASRYGLKLEAWETEDLFKHHFHFLLMLTFLPGGK